MKSSAEIKWDIEVDAERDRLIEEGVPPWDAADQARRNVSNRRRHAKMIRDVYKPGDYDAD